jgi:hypothetical protein
VLDLGELVGISAAISTLTSCAFRSSRSKGDSRALAIFLLAAIFARVDRGEDCGLVMVVSDIWDVLPLDLRVLMADEEANLLGVLPIEEKSVDLL